MATLNRFECIGNFGSIVEVKNFDNGGKIGRASLAINEDYKKEDGTKVEKTTWVNLVFPSHIVDTAAKIVTKGRQAFVEGKMETREYDKDGQKHYITEIRVGNFQLLGPKPEGSESAES